MHVIHGIAVYFDVDNTLLVFGAENDPGAFDMIQNGVALKVTPHKEHIEMLKHFKFRGHRVIVWSAGGSHWAEQVVKLLKLEQYVDLVINKPNWIVDDFPVDVFLPEINRIYIDTHNKKRYKKDFKVE